MSSRHRFRFAPAVTRLEDRETPAAGDLDPTFGTGGIQRFTSGVVSQLVTAPDGDVLALVRPNISTRPYAVQRLNADGTPDSAFGAGGVVTLPDSTSPAALTALPDGGVVVVAGFRDETSNPGFITEVPAAIRLTASGAIDPTFGTGGRTVVRVWSAADVPSLSLAVQPDGRILVASEETLDPLNAGQPPRYFRLVVTRLTTSGQLDPTFGTGGTAVVADPTGNFTSVVGGALAVQPDGRIVVGGSGSSTPRGQRPQLYGPAVARLTADGRLDPTFGAGGWTAAGFTQETMRTTATQSSRAVSVLPDGRVLFAGQVVRQDGTAVGGAARLTADGRLDPTYGSGGTAPVGPAGFVSAAIDSFGRVVFDTVSATLAQGTPVNTGGTVSRLTADGLLDPGFGAGGQVNLPALPGLNSLRVGDLNLASGLAVQPNGNILLGGTDNATQTGSTNGLIARLIGSNPPAGFVPAARGAAVVGGPANGTAQVLSPSNGTYSIAGTMTPFPGLAGNVRATTADVTGDGTPDYVTGAGPGGRPQVTVFDGKAGTTVADFLAFEAGFTGGVFVTAADLDGDGRAEVVVTPDRGGSSRVVVFSIAPGGAATQRASFFGIDDPNFRGGARAALGDVNKDGTPDLAVAAGFLGGPRTALFNGKTLFTAPARLVNDFFAFPGDDATRLRNGAFVALGDLTGDGFADLVFGGGPGGAPRVFALSGATLMAQGAAAAQASPVSNFFVGGNEGDRGGVRLATTDADGDGRADLLAGSGAGTVGRIRVYLGKTFTSSAEPGGAQDVAAFGGAVLADGVYVG